MMNKNKIDEVHQSVERGYQPTQQKPQTGNNVDLGYQPTARPDTTNVAKPPPQKP